MLDASILNQFETIYQQPNIDAMIALTPKNFERFVAYILTKAGYNVHDVAIKILKGVDIEISTPSPKSYSVGGVEVKRYQKDGLIDAKVVQKLMGAPVLRGNHKGFLVTTSNFTKPAIELAQSHKKVHLITGHQFIRYINYVRGSTYESDELPSFIPLEAFSHVHDIINSKPLKTKIIAIANNKGGVGKSTSTEYLAHALLAKGNKVLLVDFDPQANLSERLLNIPSEKIPSPHLANYFAHTVALDQTIHYLSANKMFALMPGHPQLGRLDKGGFGRPLEEINFIRDFYTTFVTSGIHQFDWIIFDTPPALSQLTRMAIATANYILIPIRLRPTSRAGTENAIQAIQTMGALIGDSPKLLGGIVTHYHDDATTRDNLPISRSQFLVSNSRLYTTFIPQDNTMEKDVSGQASGKAKVAYEQLLEEVIDDINAY